MLTDYVQGSSVTWEKNPDYWGYDAKYPQNRLPYVDQLRKLIIPEQATIMAALRSGKIDLRGLGGDAVSTIDQAESLQKTNPEIVLHKQWVRSNEAIAPNVRVPPFNDIRVRKAMQTALDLEAITATYFKGQASATPQGMVGVKGYYIPFEEWPEEVKKGYMYDPEGAKKLLAEAGYPNGFKTVLNYGPNSDLNYSEIAVSYWAEIGVDVEILVLSQAEANERMFAHTYEGMVSAISGTSYDPVTSVGWYRSDAQWNRPGAEWPELDALVDAALAATTIEEQQRSVREADMYSIEKHYQIWGPKAPHLVCSPAVGHRL